MLKKQFNNKNRNFAVSNRIRKPIGHYKNVQGRKQSSVLPWYKRRLVQGRVFYGNKNNYNKNNYNKNNYNKNNYNKNNYNKNNYNKNNYNKNNYNKNNYNKNNYNKNKFYLKRPFSRKEAVIKWIDRNLLGSELFLKQFSALILKHFFKDYSQDKKLSMLNYWHSFNKILKSDFSFTYSLTVNNNFYQGVIRTYIKVIKIFMSTFLKRLRILLKSKSIKLKLALKGFYGIYKVYSLIECLSKSYTEVLDKPDYYFPGYRSALRTAFFRCLSMFCMKIFVLANKVFTKSPLRANSPAGFFYLWKKVYKKWLNTYYQEISIKRRVPRTLRRAFIGARLTREAAAKKNPDFWRDLFRFRLERSGYKRFLLRYFYSYGYGNFKVDNPFTYRRRKYRFKLNVFGKRVYLVRKPVFRRKSTKYISWFRTLVTGGYYFSEEHADKTFFRTGYGKRAWISRRRAKHVFKMKFVFIRYFSKKFGLKNKTAFLRKAEHVARKGGNKWLRYYREFESRLLRVLVLFGFCGDGNMAKSFISNNWVLINKRIANDHSHTFIPRVKMGDMVSLTSAGSAYILKRKFRFFKKRLNFYDREDEAKLVYSLFKNYFSQWAFPTLYSINGMSIRHGLIALMSGPVVSNSKEYFSISRRIPFYNRELFKLFVQRFTKKLN